MQQAARFRRRQHRDGVGRAGGAQVGAFQRIHGDVYRGISRPWGGVAPTLSPIYNMGASSRSPSPITMVPRSAHFESAPHGLHCGVIGTGTSPCPWYAPTRWQLPLLRAPFQKPDARRCAVPRLPNYASWCGGILSLVVPLLPLRRALFSHLFASTMIITRPCGRAVFLLNMRGYVILFQKIRIVEPLDGGLTGCFDSCLFLRWRFAPSPSRR